MVVAYLYASAIPKYNTPTWSTSVDFLNELHAPAFAFIIRDTDLDGAQRPLNYSVNEFGDVIAAYRSSTTTTEYYLKGKGGLYIDRFRVAGSNYTTVIANSSALGATVSNPLGSVFRFSMNGTCTYHESSTQTTT